MITVSCAFTAKKYNHNSLALPPRPMVYPKNWCKYY